MQLDNKSSDKSAPASAAVEAPNENSKKNDAPVKRSRIKISEKWLFRLAIIIPLSGLFCVVLLSFSAYTPYFVDLQGNITGTNHFAWNYVLHAFSAFLLISGAFFFIGGLVGFLFGFPRTSDAPAENRNGLKYQHNRSIEQISDWLIKMLIGIGLSQMHQIPNAVWYYASRLTAGISIAGTTNAAPAAGACLIIFFLICGFIEGYLVTRLLLPSRLNQVDREQN